MNKVYIFLLIPFIFYSQNDDKLFAVFYNVENLFDTINNLNFNDVEYLPDSEKRWDTYKYNHKLSQIEKVFFNIIHDKNNGKIPDIIGLCEVENKLVIEDLLKTPLFNNNNYTIIHQDSPDKRGIDCALLVSKKLKIVKSDFILINNPNANRPTRDIVYAKLEFNHQLINVFVNHWPSRWGGQKETNYKRVFAANVLRDYLDNHTQVDEYNLIMGDFNDHPDNESLDKVLVNDDLVNLMDPKFVLGIGSYNYKGDWNWLDQIIISKDLVDLNKNSLEVGSYQKDFMMYKNEHGEIYPNRSFGGNRWYGGFSDHLPIYCIFRIPFN
ncbi:MAG: endonuclease [Flavobacteriales bacterium]|nr:endonuclease [Flavobacteriales bacterium]|tara:strand:- start:3168 stop:4142 length:975 start_codon:yes stop_codon:yes gene_type:complete